MLYRSGQAVPSVKPGPESETVQSICHLAMNREWQ